MGDKKGRPRTRFVRCHTCEYWVCCDEEKKVGFCLLRSLYTFTKSYKCREYEEGEYMLLGEFKKYGVYEKTNIIDKGEGHRGRLIKELPSDFTEIAKQYGGY